MATAYIETTIPSYYMTMKVSDNPIKVVDEVISEVRAIKRAISASHGDDIDSLLASLISQERASGIDKAEQGAVVQPATAADSRSEGDEKPEPASEGRPQ